MYWGEEMDPRWNEPDSLDEEALQDDDVVWDVLQHKYVFKPTSHDSSIFDVPEYQHPEDTMELFEEYERTIDERYPSDS